MGDHDHASLDLGDVIVFLPLEAPKEAGGNVTEITAPFLEILVLIAEKVIHREIQLSPDIILDTVRHACSYLTETDEIRLRVHPSDFENIREIERIISTQLTGNGSIHFIEDTTIERGGIIIETEYGEIDASIRSQIEHMQEVLLEK